MEKRLVIGKRIFGVRCSDRCDPKIQRVFFKLLKKFEREIMDLMDTLEVPKEVLINFKGGEKELAGKYYVNADYVSKNVIVLDIYTDSFEKLKELDYELMDTFIHEIVHHVIEDEEETQKITKKFMKNVKL